MNPTGYKAPQRRRTKARALARERASSPARLRKWATRRLADPEEFVPVHRQVALDALEVLDQLERSGA